MPFRSPSKNPLALLGAYVLSVLYQIGHFCLFGLRGVIAIFRPPFYLQNTLHQLIFTGYNSLPVVGMTALFTGAVLALQIFIGSTRFNAEDTVAAIVVIGITRELGPVITGLMIAGRIAAAQAAEIGTMRVTEQIDALKTLATPPLQYLVAPRLIATTISMPLLTIVADAMGILGGMLVSTQKLNISNALYIQKSLEFLVLQDVLSGLTKACVFGMIIALCGCYFGFYSQRGSQGVGKATTHSVVTASIMILAANYLVSALFFS